MNLNKGLVGHWTMDSADTDNGMLYDGENRKMYVNSDLVENPNTASFSNRGDSDLHIGQRPDGERNYGGFIGDVKIYNRVLSESEIQQLYNMRSQRTSNI